MKTDSLGRRINPGSKGHLLKHGGVKYHKKTYQCWQDMKQRCLNRNSRLYPSYGGRGILVCDRWTNSFQAFFEDMGEKPDGMTLDRIDNNGNYSPENCRWASAKEQGNNKRTCTMLTFKGETHTVTEWAERIGRHQTTLHTRLKAGWPIEMVLSNKKLHFGDTPAIIKFQLSGSDKAMESK